MICYRSESLWEDLVEILLKSSSRGACMKILRSSYEALLWRPCAILYIDLYRRSCCCSFRPQLLLLISGILASYPPHCLGPLAGVFISDVFESDVCYKSVSVTEKHQCNFYLQRYGAPGLAHVQIRLSLINVKNQLEHLSQWLANRPNLKGPPNFDDSMLVFAWLVF